MTSRLEKLRDELAAVDRSMLELAAKRAELAAEVGREKRRGGLPTRDFAQERDVIERARALAAELKLSPELAESLMLALIRAALVVQERDRLTTARSGKGQRALVIGGGGKMGRWFVSFLSSQGYAVSVADPATAAEGVTRFPDWRDVRLDHDVIVAASPLLVTNRIFLELALEPPPGLVFDVGSLKSPLRPGLLALARAGARVTSIHPMFGPDTELLSGRHVIFVDVGVPEATARARELFATTMAEQVEMDLESHDRLIAYVLGLSHALNIAFFTALAESGEAAPRLAKLSSTTFDAQLDVARKVAGENPQLYFEIQSLNDYGAEPLAALAEAVERLREVVRAGDVRGFAGLMERGLEYFEGRRT